MSTAQRRTTPLAHACAEPHACPTGLRRDVLAHAPYFTDLSAEEVADVDGLAQSLGYHEGQLIYPAGAPADALFVLATGRVKLVRPSLDGNDVVVEVLKPGDIFGSVSASGVAAYPDTAQSLTVSCALRISAADFRGVLRRHPDVALRVLDDVAARLDRSQQTVRRLSGGTVEQRVAATLLALADSVGEARGDAVLLQLPLTRSDLAAMTGTTTESVSRVLSRLRSRGLVETGRRWTSLLDPEALAALTH